MEKEIKTLIIAPHCDDIAISLGGIILSNFFEKPLKIVTIFSESNYAPCIKEINVESISRVRYTEEYKYAKIIGAKLDHLQFPDSSLRAFYRQQIDKFNDLEELPESFIVEICNSLSNILSAHPEANVICPLGISNHVDHLLASSICTSLCIKYYRKIIYYEDLPYAFDLSLKDIRQRVDILSKICKLEIKPCKININGKLNYKVNNLRIYKSQICTKKYIFKVNAHSARIGFKYDNLMDFIWRYSVFKRLFKRYYIKFNLQLYERVWETNPEPNIINELNSSQIITKCLLCKVYK